MFCNNSATFKRALTGLIPERLCRDKKKYEEAFKVFSSFFFLSFFVLCYMLGILASRQVCSIQQTQQKVPHRQVS